MSLRERLIRQLTTSGPIDVDQYMTACLHDPDFGYYATRPALGAAGDFITAPLVSQMFGELIGLWLAECWTRLGRPCAVRLVEVGPGDGTLMGDILRVATLVPGFREALEVWLVEASAPLAQRQQERLGDRLHWVGALSEVAGEAPVLLIANELLDCLPARQFVRRDRAWAERLVGVDADGGLAFGLARTPAQGLLPDAPPGAVLEVSSAQAAFGAHLGRLVADHGGAALLIDYGRAEPGFGDTLQALLAHAKVDPLACPGEADLTVHADFPAVLAAAREQGALTATILTQAELLSRLGVVERCAALSASRPDKASQLARQRERLTAADQMGELFKAACIHSPGWIPPAFEEAA
ncbi:MAG: SAM-dependent methyltransferase [Phenylobacterium sp.]|uniref:class I SAM-dependent methyltransferase n=1 Tax=Phenylobacterium sp. TaxID=1871053 RepID=UPI0027348B25|nr:SAM-dependent methyltransferase [Phenylobacterium sp.]MDP3175469.1 SAM-dependent methyltransferase [Phenylobacterium sp.]